MLWPLRPLLKTVVASSALSAPSPQGSQEHSRCGADGQRRGSLGSAPRPSATGEAGGTTEPQQWSFNKTKKTLKLNLRVLKLKISFANNYFCQVELNVSISWCKFITLIYTLIIIIP